MAATPIALRFEVTLTRSATKKRSAVGFSAALPTEGLGSPDGALMVAEVSQTASVVSPQSLRSNLPSKQAAGTTVNGRLQEGGNAPQPAIEIAAGESAAGGGHGDMAGQYAHVALLRAPEQKLRKSRFAPAPASAPTPVAATTANASQIGLSAAVNTSNASTSLVNSPLAVLEPSEPAVPVEAIGKQSAATSAVKTMLPRIAATKLATVPIKVVGSQSAVPFKAVGRQSAADMQSGMVASADTRLRGAAEGSRARVSAHVTSTAAPLQGSKLSQVRETWVLVSPRCHLTSPSIAILR